MAIVQLRKEELIEPPPPLTMATVDSRAHTLLVERGATWLRRMGCKIVLEEFKALTDEIPDVLGFGHGASFLVEAKTSRWDFQRDCRKPHRATPSTGMGDYRYFICPPKLIKAEELPLGWGLLYAHEKNISLVAGCYPSRKFAFDGYRFREKNDRAEQAVLLSALNRLRLHHGDRQFDELVHATYASKKETKP